MKKFFAIIGILALAACAGSKNDDTQHYAFATPTVDYIEQLDVYSAPHRDGFLIRLAMNYRSFAIFNARTVGDTQMGELFAHKAVSAFSGETPFPESVDNWPIADARTEQELRRACSDLIRALKNDAAETCPDAAAEAQAKFDCWLAKTSVNDLQNAEECRVRFVRAMNAINSGTCGRTAAPANRCASAPGKPCPNANRPAVAFYPETASMRSAASGFRAREGVVIVNNVNIPDNLINPVPVPPMVFNQNIVTNGVPGGEAASNDDIPMLGDQYVTRDEFINMMMAMRAELRAINDRLDAKPAPAPAERAVIKVQQIPLEPRQHLMEEIFVIHFNFDKYDIKPEYEPLIRQLVDATRGNKNVRVSVVGHTDTMGTDEYNFALGGRRADTVRQRLIQYGIPASQIVATSAGKRDLAVQTGDQVKNAQNRRVQVIKETRTEEPPQPNPMRVTIRRPDALAEEEFIEYFDSGQ
ncbi:MAG: OmpA family protein [Alphaproteobacteria bacterium]|nr:OmpA family protein [Alphaproteobacteria bacterium]MCL2889876.1 OmpA family protein [Alphaproteobacteria bacterium]